MTVLDTRALNRATLARQLLLDRADMPVLDAVAHLGGLQAQEPQEPFVGLWSRLRAFDPAVLSDLLTARSVVRTHLMRRTVHLVTADDVLAWRARHDAMLRQRVLGVYRSELAGVDLDELAAAGRAVMADGEPRSMSELARALADRWPKPGPRPLGELLVAALIPMVQLPPRGLWRTRAGVRNLPLASWLGREIDPPAPDGSDPVGQALVRRYLAAFGPAASADLRAWCGLAGLPAAIAAVREELVDLPRRARPGTAGPSRRTAPRPRHTRPGAVPAGVRQRDPRLPRPRPDHRRRPSRAVGRRRSRGPGRRPGRGDLDRGGGHRAGHPAAPPLPGRPHRRGRAGAGVGRVPLRQREPPCTDRRVRLSSDPPVSDAGASATRVTAPSYRRSGQPSCACRKSTVLRQARADDSGSWTSGRPSLKKAWSAG